MIDLTSERYGRLIVLGEADRQGYHRLWRCQCDCGKEILARMNNLRNGHTQSCGCLQAERVSTKNLVDLSGRRFGRLVVIDRAKRKSRRVFWRCQCDCGKEIITTSDHLNQGYTISCGCARSDGIKRARKSLLITKAIDGVPVPLLTKKVRIDSHSGQKGVYFRKKDGKYRAIITLKGKQYHAGDFESLKDAVAARKRLEDKYHKPYIDALAEKENSPIPPKE